MNNKSRGLKKDLWWMIPLAILALVFVIVRFDPVGDLVGQQNKQWVVSLIIIIGIALTFFMPTRRR